MIHELKTWPDYFERVTSGEKKVEIRRGNRDYGTGDTLLLNEWDPSTEAYTGRSCKAAITHILRGPWLADGHVALSINLITESTQENVEQSHLEDVPAHLTFLDKLDKFTTEHWRWSSIVTLLICVLVCALIYYATKSIVSINHPYDPIDPGPSIVQ